MDACRVHMYVHHYIMCMSVCAYFSASYVWSLWFNNSSCMHFFIVFIYNNAAGCSRPTAIHTAAWVFLHLTEQYRVIESYSTWWWLIVRTSYPVLPAFSMEAALLSWRACAGAVHAKELQCTSLLGPNGPTKQLNLFIMKPVLENNFWHISWMEPSIFGNVGIASRQCRMLTHTQFLTLANLFHLSALWGANCPRLWSCGNWGQPTRHAPRSFCSFEVAFGFLRLGLSAFLCRWKLETTPISPQKP